MDFAELTLRLTRTIIVTFVLHKFIHFVTHIYLHSTKIMKRAFSSTGKRNKQNKERKKLINKIEDLAKKKLKVN